MRLLLKKKKHRDLQLKINQLEQRLRTATEILQQIASGNLDVSFEKNPGIEDESGKDFYATLEKTSEKLKQYWNTEQQRKWATEGMERFISLIQGDRSAASFYDDVLAYIVRRLDANQGGIFLLNDRDPEDPHLELKACYAYSKKKFIGKKVGIGQGILGQAFLEKETSVYTTVPDQYFTITSGLGEARPRFLIIIPLRHEKQRIGVMEIASFHRLEKYRIEFLEKLCESLASVVINIQQAATASRLFEDSQLYAKRLLEQEESLRQNIEELQSTQEEMKRNQQDMANQSHLLKFIIDNIPFPIFVKDEQGRYTMVNAAEAQLFDVPDSEVLGRDDSAFVASPDEWKVIRQSDERALNSNAPVELPIQYFTTRQGSSHIFKTTKIPFLNNVTGKKNILGVSIDLTEKTNLERKLVFERSINTVNALINLAGRQRMLSQKIGLYAEMAVKGKQDAVPVLKAAVDLFEHSLNVIRDGGLPMGITCESDLPAASASLMPYIQNIESVWKPYKDAANRIFYYSSFHDPQTAHAKDHEMQTSIGLIEGTAEDLLSLNNELMLACIQANEKNVKSTPELRMS